MKIRAKKIKKGSLFKLILASMIVPMGAFFLLCGIAALFGADTVKWKNEPVTGVFGLLTAILMYPFFIIIFTSFIWIGTAVGLWIFSWFRKVEIEFVEGEIIETSGAEQDDLGNADKPHS